MCYNKIQEQRENTKLSKDLSSQEFSVVFMLIESQNPCTSTIPNTMKGHAHQAESSSRWEHAQFKAICCAFLVALTLLFFDVTLFGEVKLEKKRAVSKGHPCQFCRTTSSSVVSHHDVLFQTPSSFRAGYAEVRQNDFVST